jgi:hypothetical protein
MKNVIIYTNEFGGVAICTPTRELPIEQVQAKDCPANSFIVNTSSLPEADNDFFDAWEQNNGVVTVNFAKSKEITKNRLRAERQPLLQLQDVAFQRALETGADTAPIIAEKNRLRNITSLVDGCSSLDELRSISVN